MNYATGPPDWSGFFEGLVLIAAFYFTVFPFVYVIDELHPRTSSVVYLSQSA